MPAIFIIIIIMRRVDILILCDPLSEACPITSSGQVIISDR